MLTPEVRIEYESKQKEKVEEEKRKQDAIKEYLVMLKAAGLEIVAEKTQREQDRAEQRRQLLAIQDELKRVREAKTATVRTESK